MFESDDNLNIISKIVSNKKLYFVCLLYKTKYINKDENTKTEQK